MSDDPAGKCEGHECYEMIYDAKMINAGEFRITRLYLPGKDNDVQTGSIAPTEAETEELMGQFENSIIRRLESQKGSLVKCPQGCQCVFNGRFSEWSEWRDYPEDRITVVARTAKKDSTASCEWKLMGSVKIRYKKRLGDCFSERLDEGIKS